MEWNIVKDLRYENFLPGGFGYILKETTFGEEKNFVKDLLNGSRQHENKVNFNLAFANKIQEIIDKRKDDDMNGTIKLLNQRTNQILEKKKNSILDIIILAQSGLSGIERDAISFYSIIYFKLQDNVYFGFYIDKNLAQQLLGDE